MAEPYDEGESGAASLMAQMRANAFVTVDPFAGEPKPLEPGSVNRRLYFHKQALTFLTAILERLVEEIELDRERVKALEDKVAGLRQEVEQLRFEVTQLLRER